MQFLTKKTLQALVLCLLAAPLVSAEQKSAERRLAELDYLGKTRAAQQQVENKGVAASRAAYHQKLEKQYARANRFLDLKHPLSFGNPEVQAAKGKQQAERQQK